MMADNQLLMELYHSCCDVVNQTEFLEEDDSYGDDELSQISDSLGCYARLFCERMVQLGKVV